MTETVAWNKSAIVSYSKVKGSPELKILYDLLVTQTDHNVLYSGGSEYGKTVFLELAKSIDERIELTVFYDKDLYLDEKVFAAIETKTIPNIDIKNEKELEKHLFENEYDLFFSPLPIHYPKIKIPKSCLYVGVLHDIRLLDIVYDENYRCCILSLGRKSLKRYIFAQSLRFPFISTIMTKLKYIKMKKIYEGIAEPLDVIVTVSEHSKYTILYHLDNVKNKSFKVYYAPRKTIANYESDDGNDKDKDKNKYGKYLLLISANRFEKNPVNAIKALDLLYSKGLLEAKCVTVGNLPEKIRKKIKYQDKFIHLDYVSNQELESLYKNAQVFIFPTLNEGFGMPPLEALKYKTKVAASAITAVPEICGSSIFYFNPYSVDEMAVRIYQAINSDKPDNHSFLKTSKRQSEDLKKLVADIKNGFGQVEKLKRSSN